MSFGFEPTVYLHKASRLGSALGISLFVQRDDLLPFSFASNKSIKLRGELKETFSDNAVVITNGGVTSNHCRALANWAAERGIAAHFVLHGTPARGHDSHLTSLCKMGAQFDLVEPTSIASRVDELKRRYEQSGMQVVVIPGGGHSPEATKAYMDYALPVVNYLKPDVIVHASGTGGTQSGIMAACQAADLDTRVIGVSVARSRERGIAAIEESLKWVTPNPLSIEFLDEYVDGGYGVSGPRTERAVEIAWRHGLPLDHTYTGKAFAGLIDRLERKDIPRSQTVLYWHTGGAFNAFVE